MIDVDEALRILFENIRPGSAVEMELRAALFRTLAEPVRCDVDYPPFDRSVMDGYAVRVADVVAAPVELHLVGRIAAGAESDRALGPGEAMQINTGAPIPAGADCVVRVEDTEERDNGTRVLIRAVVERGKFITRRATYAQAGRAVLERGAVLTPVNIGVAATAGAHRVTVYRPPSVAILVTGNELVGIDVVPGGARIRNSNQYVLEALFTAAHVHPVVLGVVGDDRAALRERIEEGLRCDLLCVTGGVSMGAFDFVPGILEELGGRFLIHKLAIKPGRPIHVAAMPGGQFVFALPGNPMSAFVGFELLVRPALAAMQGRPGQKAILTAATLCGTVQATSDRRSYLPALARVNEEGTWEVAPLPWHGSGDALGTANANTLIMRPPRSAGATSGQTVSIILLDGP